MAASEIVQSVRTVVYEVTLNWGGGWRTISSHIKQLTTILGAPLMQHHYCETRYSCSHSIICHYLPLFAVSVQLLDKYLRPSVEGRSCLTTPDTQKNNRWTQNSTLKNLQILSLHSHLSSFVFHRYSSCLPPLLLSQINRRMSLGMRSTCMRVPSCNSFSR